MQIKQPPRFRSSSQSKSEVAHLSSELLFKPRQVLAGELRISFSADSRAQRHGKITPWPESASELYRPRDRRLSTKLVPAFAGRGCRVVSASDPYGRFLGLLHRSRFFFFQAAPQLYSRGRVDPIPDHYSSEILVVLGIELGTSGSLMWNEFQTVHKEAALSWSGYIVACMCVNWGNPREISEYPVLRSRFELSTSLMQALQLHRCVQFWHLHWRNRDTQFWHAVSIGLHRCNEQTAFNKFKFQPV
jgi:hypothetical protein